MTDDYYSLSDTTSVTFSRHPGQLTQGVIDFGSKPGWNHWKMATQKLQDDLYDCKPEGFYQFIKNLKSRANYFGWLGEGGILQVAPNPKKPTEVRCLLEDYGVFSYDRLVEHEKTYISSDTRAAQDNCMLFTCLMNSLSSSGKAKLNVHDKQYLIGDPPNESGLCLLKILIRESHLDSNATSSMIRTKLSNLDEYLVETNNDILKFNNHVRMLMDSLTARGETTQDLLTNLFKAYAACSDSTFVKYVADIQTKWEDGEEMTPERLMERVSNKYKIMKTKEVWNAPSAEQKKLVALGAKISELKKKYEDKKAKLDQSKKRESNKRESNKEKGTDTSNQKKTKLQKPTWMFQKPKDADLRKPREWNGSKWHYCSPETGGKCNGVYRIHKPSECRSKGQNQGSGGERKGKNVKSKEVTISEALSEVNGNGYESE